MEKPNKLDMLPKHIKEVHFHTHIFTVPVKSTKSVEISGQ